MPASWHCNLLCSVQMSKLLYISTATVNHTGSDCPYALKMVACQVLLEITTFLRETYQYIPKNKVPRREQGWDKNVSSRRWSCVLSSPGHSERSNSRSSQGDVIQLSVGECWLVWFAISRSYQRSNQVSDGGHSSLSPFSGFVYYFEVMKYAVLNENHFKVSRIILIFICWVWWWPWNDPCMLKPWILFSASDLACPDMLL